MDCENSKWTGILKKSSTQIKTEKGIINNGLVSGGPRVFYKLKTGIFELAVGTLGGHLVGSRLSCNKLSHHVYGTTYAITKA